MRIWVKLVLGSLLGILLGLYLPPAGMAANVITFLSRVSFQFGRFLVFPVIFFSFLIATYELRLQKRLFQTLRCTLLYGLGISVGFLILGILFVLILSPQRIPIIVSQRVPLQILSMEELILTLIPTNAFQALIGQGDYILPVLFFAFVLGINLNFDRQITRSIVELADSLNRLLWHINTFVTEFLYVPILFISSSLILTLRRQNDISIFTPFLSFLAFLTIFLFLVVLPIAYYLFHKKRNPFTWLYAQLGPGIVSVISGDVLFGYGQLARHGHETLGIPRKMGAVISPILLVFFRSGSAFIMIVTFLVLFRSYSILELSPLQLIWVMLLALAVSFGLWASPGSGTLIGLVFVSRLVGRGVEEGYQILGSVMPLLISLGAFLDIVTVSFVSQLVSKRMNCLHPEEKRRRI